MELAAPGRENCFEQKRRLATSNRCFLEVFKSHKAEAKKKNRCSVLVEAVEVPTKLPQKPSTAPPKVPRPWETVESVASSWGRFLMVFCKLLFCLLGFWWVLQVFFDV